MHSCRVAVLILGYNHRETLSETIASVLDSSYADREIIYIDNASTDGSADLVRSNYPDIRVIQHATNLGYAKAYKNALTEAFKADFDAAVLLNPDIIVQKNWLDELVRSAYTADTIAFVQPKIYLWQNGPTHSFNTCGNEIQFLGFGYCGCYGNDDTQTLCEDRDIAYASGACLFVKKKPYHALPGLDESFFAYLEDQDLGWQAREYGYRNIISAHSIVWHKYDFEKKHLAGLKFYLLERNRFIFIVKHFSFRLLFLIFPALIFMEIGMLFHATTNGYLGAKLRSTVDFLFSIRKTLAARAIIQSERTVSDRELFPFLKPTVDFKAVQSPLLSFANTVLTRYHTLIKHLI